MPRPRGRGITGGGGAGLDRILAVLLAELLSVELLARLVPGVAEARADVITGVPDLVGHAVVTVRPAPVLLGLVLGLSVGCLCVIHLSRSSVRPTSAGDGPEQIGRAHV